MKKETQKKVNHMNYFFEGRAIDEYADEVKKRNFQYLRAFSILGIITAVCTVVYGQVMRDVADFNGKLLLLLVYFLLCFLVSLILKNHQKYMILASYLQITPLMIWGILMGSFLHPERPSVVIMVFLSVLPLFILDKPWRVLLFILWTAAVYTVCCESAKSDELFVEDMVNLVLFTFTGIGINMLTLGDRINNIINSERLRNKSEKDSLTNLYNHGAGEEKIKELIDDKQYGMFCIMDIDDFKTINDRFGHNVGDMVLQEVSQLLCECFRKKDIIARLGGDEFAVYAIGVTDKKTGQVCAEKMYDMISTIDIEEDPDYEIGVSMGCAFYKEGDTEMDFKQLYKKGDETLYNVKTTQKGRWEFSL